MLVRCMAPVQMLIKINKHGGTPATSMAAGSNLSSVTTATTAMIPAGGECGKPGSHAYYGPAMTLSISWAAQYNDGPADMAVS